MADGSVKSISQVTIGDEVVATDPETGETSAQPVTMLHLNRDAELTNVTVSSTPVAGERRDVGEGAGERSTRGPTTVLETTQNHPFWDHSAGAWVDAADLVPGESTLIGPDGQIQYVVAVENFLGSEDMRDLTVATIHTYYVIAGDTPVLVHNCPSQEPGFFERLFGKKAQPERPEPNAKIRDLEGIGHDNVDENGKWLSDPIKEARLRSLTDEQLMASVFEPDDEYRTFMLYHSGDNYMVEGNHRMAELLRRAKDPFFKITLDDRIYIRGWGR